jgi:hypothetical protein
MKAGSSASSHKQEVRRGGLASKGSGCEAVRAGLALMRSISELMCNERTTTQTDPFQANPPGRGHLADFPRCSLLTYQFRYARRSRLENQPNDPAAAGRYASYL